MINRFPAPEAPGRDAFADWAHVPSDVRFEGRACHDPLVTIAITTYKRADFLAEAVVSAIEQLFDQPYEVLIVDNDPASRGFDDLLGRLPQLAEHCFRYYVNRQNLGMFGNFNRAIELARGRWVSILNDDDLLDPNYLQMMFDEIGRHPETEGIVSRKRWLDQRAPIEASAAAVPPANDAGSLRSFAGRVLPEGSIGRAVLRRVRSAPHALKARARALGLRWHYHHLFGNELSRVITPGMFFWGPVVGNGGGFVFRRDVAIELGGFDANEGTGADLWVFARFAARNRLRQYRLRGATIRVAENASGNKDVSMSGMLTGYAVQQAMIGRHVPSWWRWFAPLVSERLRGEFVEGWRIDLPKSELESLLGIKLPKDRPSLLRAIRLIMGGSYPDAL